MRQLIISIFALCLTALPAMASEKKMNAYPNPIDRGAALTVSMPTGDYGELTVILYNTVGRAIHTTKTTGKEVEFPAPDISGIYILRIFDKQRVIAVEKIVVKE